MPRRPRPAYRLPPKSARQKVNLPKFKRPSKTSLAGNDTIPEKEARSTLEFEEGSSRTSQKKSKNGKQLQAGPPEAKLPLKCGRALPRQESALDEEGETEEEFEEGSSEGSVVFGEEDDDESDGDAPRVAVWEEDNQDFLVEGFDGEKEMENEKSLQNDLQDLPLGALRRAQRLLTQAEAETESGSDSDQLDLPYGEDNVPKSKGKGKEKVEWSTKPRTDIASRPHKHAPAELTAKKPVSRHRVVVDVPKIVPRDPRFLTTAGVFDPQKFQRSYGFLAENRRTELQTIKESLAKARKALGSSPLYLKSERENEVQMLEHAVKRVESLVNKDRLDTVEQEALTKRKKEEVEKRKQGKGQWFLKKAEKKELLLKARYEALAKEGGQRAVKKAIEKKQKKINQKEKRSRPYRKDESRKREGEAPADRPSKRARILS